MHRNCGNCHVNNYLRIIGSRSSVKNCPYRSSISKKDDSASEMKIQKLDWIRTCAGDPALLKRSRHETMRVRSSSRAIVALINSQQITRRSAERRARAGRATILVANRKAPRDPTKAPSKGPLSSPSVYLVPRPFSTSFPPRASLSLSLRPLSSFPSSLRVPLLHVRRSVFLPSRFAIGFRYSLSFSLARSISHFSTPSPLSYKH